jgi:hypothetical protein
LHEKLISLEIEAVSLLSDGSVEAELLPMEVSHG